MPAESDAVHVYRVTVRGRFDRSLDDARRRSLAADSSEHDIGLSGFTEEGTFTYDSRVDFFNLRYEIRLRAEESATDAETLALLQAEEFLRILRLPHRGLRAASMDMTAMTNRSR